MTPVQITMKLLQTIAYCDIPLPLYLWVSPTIDVFLGIIRRRLSGTDYAVKNQSFYE